MEVDLHQAYNCSFWRRDGVMKYVGAEFYICCYFAATLKET